MTDRLRLYFVAHAEPCDINRDLVLWAYNPGDAIQYWRRYFELPEECDPFDLFECRHAPRAGPVVWHYKTGFELLPVKRE